MSWIGVITNAGAALLAQWTAGDHSLTIDKATVGSGVRSVVNLRTATALAQEEADGSIVSAKPVTGGTQFRIRVSPAAVTAYTAHEIGIWGHLDDDDDNLTLIAIHQDADTGVEVPTAASMPSFQFDLYCLHAIGNEGELNITLTEEVYPTVDEMDEAIAGVLGNFATVEATSTASQAYAVGKFLVLNGVLYRVTTAIASGGTITPNTNCVQTTVGDEIANDTLFFKDKAVTATTGDILVINDDRITTDHVLTECVWGNSSYITTNVTWTTAAGSLTLNGTATAATTATVTLVKKDN